MYPSRMTTPCHRFSYGAPLIYPVTSKNGAGISFTNRPGKSIPVLRKTALVHCEIADLHHTECPAPSKNQVLSLLTTAFFAVSFYGFSTPFSLSIQGFPRILAPHTKPLEAPEARIFSAVDRDVELWTQNMFAFTVADRCTKHHAFHFRSRHHQTFALLTIIFFAKPSPFHGRHLNRFHHITRLEIHECRIESIDGNRTPLMSRLVGCSRRTS